MASKGLCCGGCDDPPSAIVGGCCLGGIQCIVTSEIDCSNLGGAYQGNGSTCTDCEPMACDPDICSDTCGNGNAQNEYIAQQVRLNLEECTNPNQRVFQLSGCSQIVQQAGPCLWQSNFQVCGTGPPHADCDTINCTRSESFQISCTTEGWLLQTTIEASACDVTGQPICVQGDCYDPGGPIIAQFLSIERGPTTICPGNPARPNEPTLPALTYELFFTQGIAPSPFAEAGVFGASQ